MIHVDLNDKYDLSKERVFITGTQALVRLCLLQSERDRRAGLNTAGYVSGYRGSPLGGLDAQFPRANAQLDEANVIFEPGFNEELAATAIWGTQQAELRGEGSYDGVFGMWYGKGPGVDRSGDAFRHGNLAGTSKNGGVLVLMGDDHTCESSTTSHQSEYALVDAQIPIFNPAGIEDILEFGLHGWALSRFAGVWCGLKLVKDNVESSASIDARLDRFTSVTPEFAMPEGGLNIRLEDTPQEQEARLHQYKIEAVKAYAAANGLNRVILGGGAAPKIGIVSAGKSYMDTLQALEELGIDEARAEAIGLSLFKVGMTWPLEPSGITKFADGLDLIVVVEEKRGLIEDQMRALLYGKPGAPAIVGKRDETGAVLFQSEAALNPLQIAAAIGKRTPDGDVQAKAAAIFQALGAEREQLSIARRPTFCAGCPHNSSTVVPDGSRAYAGIGCHYMVQWIDRNTKGYTQMGGEGANWIGESKFSERRHVFQNIGDGTYNHSGILAIRAAVGSGTTMTFKILYNDAVAMTGGQGHDGGMNVYQIAAEVKAAGVKRLEFVTDDVDQVDKSRLPAGTKVHDRGNLQAVQTELAQVRGVSALIYDQTCAAEKRRRRKRGLFPDPAKRVVINEAVCEGCGDCSAKSNCVAILPLETTLGTKRQIDQSACNKDFSCLRGFCPSFVTVEGVELRKPEVSDDTLPEVPDPDSMPSLDEPFAIALTGIGGTGVVTVGAILGMAAHLEGRGCGIIDMAGLAQKGGAVVSHIKLAAQPEDIKTIRIASGGADLILGCDMVVAAGGDLLATLAPEGAAVVNSHEMVTSDFTSKPDFKLPVNAMQTRIRAATGKDRTTFVDATDIALQLLGDSIAANQFLLGVAYQRGHIPLRADAILKALELNGVAVERNQLAFQTGRQWVHDRSKIESNLRPAPTVTQSLDELIASRVDLLTAYKSPRYAKRYLKLVERVRAIDQGEELTRAVAHSVAKLMAYKDEYEVARLYSDGKFAAKIEDMFEGDPKLKIYLAPPMLAKTDPVTGEPLKKAYGASMFKALGLMAKLKGLRGTPFDPFGYTAERKMERRLIKDYAALVGELVTSYETIDYDIAVEMARLPEMARGFGHVKVANVEKMKARETELRARLSKTAAEAAA